MNKAPRHPGRKRRRLGWAAVVLGVIIGGIWAGSGWGWAGYRAQTWFVKVDAGRLEYGCGPYLHTERMWQTGWNSGRYDSRRPQIAFWRPGEFFPSEGSANIRFTTGVFAFVNVPGDYRFMDMFFWPLPLGLFLAGFPLLHSGMRARRRARANCCPRCGYDRRGLAPDALCPECGQ